MAYFNNSSRRFLPEQNDTYPTIDTNRIDYIRISPLEMYIFWVPVIVKAPFRTVTFDWPAAQSKRLYLQDSDTSTSISIKIFPRE